MRRLRSALIAIFLLAPQLSLAQISPGELTRAHAGLEGISNCSQCHESGQEISGSKCLACHSEIRKEIDLKRGFHFANSGNNCVSCHKDHLGKDARITQFDESRFDHSRTGFGLSGKHGELKCEQCHIDKFVNAVEVKNILKDHPHRTFLGLDQRCAACHADRHKSTVNNECQTCHSTTSWKPAPTFDHRRAKFALAGKHRSLECAKCHTEMNPKSASDPVLFAAKNFADCTPCHASPHGTKFADKTCKSCHTADGWKVVAAFNHSVTSFPLAGKHSAVACGKCHTEMAAKKGKTVDFRTKDFADCNPCHTSPHSGTFPQQQCKSCHTATSWAARGPIPFDHAVTRFKLAGKHSSLQCEKCHNPTQPKSTYAQRFKLAYSRCTDCHADYHKGQFAARYANDCALCHNENAYTPSLFTIAKHADTKFPLKGAHGAVPCNDCHRKPGQKESIFTFTGIRCESCHVDKHKGMFNRFMADLSCARCHSMQDWKSVLFDHVSTTFALVGKHLTVKCADCHKEQIAGGVKSLQYQGVPTDCQSCHKDIHLGQFAQMDKTQCGICHSPQAWRTLLFIHETQSAFPLTGAHKNVPCRSCHKEEKFSGQTIVRYKPLPTKCESCHQGVIK